MYEHTINSILTVIEKRTTQKNVTVSKELKYLTDENKRTYEKSLFTHRKKEKI